MSEHSFLESYASDRAELLRVLGTVDDTWRGFSHPGRDLHGQSAGLVATELEGLRRSIADRRLSIGVFGLIKRGKSTLLNALVGREVSPTHVTPETAVPILVEDGPVPMAEAHLAGGEVVTVDPSDLHRYTSQKTDPDERLPVAYVHVRVPSQLLKAGVRLIDTPGLDDGEVDESYTERTIQQLESVDAGLLVIMSPPTLGATEVRYLREVAAQRAREFILVCNMVPQHFHDPQARADVTDYVRRQVDAVGLSVEVRAVCAQDAWDARCAGDQDAWRRSGVDELVRELEDGLVRRAARRSIRTAADHALEAIRLARIEIGTERTLLTDEGQRATLEQDAGARIAELRHDATQAIDNQLERVRRVPQQLNDLLLQRFYTAKLDVAEAGSFDDLEQVLRRVRRQVEVTSELAARQVREAIAVAVERLHAELGDEVATVLGHLDLTHLDRGSRVLDISDDNDRGVVDPVLGGATVGGLVGGVGLTMVGAVLGPVGLIAGAIVGWRLGDGVRRGRNLQRAREVVIERIDELVDALAQDFQRRVDDQVQLIRDTVEGRYQALSDDIDRQLTVTAEMGKDEASVAVRLRQCEEALRELDEAGRAARTLIDVPAPTIRR